MLRGFGVSIRWVAAGWARHDVGDGRRWLWFVIVAVTAVIASDRQVRAKPRGHRGMRVRAVQ